MKIILWAAPLSLALSGCDAGDEPREVATPQPNTAAASAEVWDPPPPIDDARGLRACYHACKIRARNAYLACMKPVQANWEFCKAERDSVYSTCILDCSL